MTQPVKAPIQGQNVQPVRDAIEAMRAGTGSFEDLQRAVQGARFAVRPTARSDEDLAAVWDYVPLPDSFTDTVVAARWQKVITADQAGELQKMAQFVGPEPSRMAQDTQTEGAA
jgi:uracil phosphoribosyltransferase